MRPLLKIIPLLSLAYAVQLHAESEATPPASKEKPAIKEVSPGIYELNSVRLEKEERRVSVPCKINMTEGLLEYLVVTERGSTHESLLITEVNPQDVHTAMLLLGAKGSETKDADVPGQINAEFLARAPKLTGDNITLKVEWTDKDGAKQQAGIEKWIIFKRPVKEEYKITEVPEGPWLYTGSYFHEDKFMAQYDGLLASLVVNPMALINNPRPEAKEDMIWHVNAKAVPARTTPVQLIITLDPAK